MKIVNFKIRRKTQKEIVLNSPKKYKKQKTKQKKFGKKNEKHKAKIIKQINANYKNKR